MYSEPSSVLYRVYSTYKKLVDHFYLSTVFWSGSNLNIASGYLFVKNSIFHINYLYLSHASSNCTSIIVNPNFA